MFLHKSSREFDHSDCLTKPLLCDGLICRYINMYAFVELKAISWNFSALARYLEGGGLVAKKLFWFGKSLSLSFQLDPDNLLLKARNFRHDDIYGYCDRVWKFGGGGEVSKRFRKLPGIVACETGTNTITSTVRFLNVFLRNLKLEEKRNLLYYSM